MTPDTGPYSVAPQPESGTPDREKILADANALAEAIRKKSEEEMDRITRLAGQRIREIRLKRDADIKAVVDHAKARTRAIARGEPDPGPLAIDDSVEATAPEFARGASAELKAPEVPPVKPAHPPQIPARPAPEAARPAPPSPPPLRAAGPTDRTSAFRRPSAEVPSPSAARPAPPSVTPRPQPAARHDLGDEMDVDPPKTLLRGQVAPPMYERVNVARPITPEEWSQIADTAARGLVSTPARRDDADAAIPPRKRLEQAEAALKADPTNPDMFCHLAGVQMELGMQAQGMINYLRAAEGYSRTGQDEKTMQIYNLLTMISPDDYALHGQMVMLALRLHNAQEAVEKLKWLCNELIERGRQNEAVEVVDRVLDEHPMVLEVLLMKTHMLVACERRDDAVRHLGQSVGLMVANNKIAEAHELVEQGLEIDPSNSLWSQLRDDIVGEMRRTGMNPIIDDEEEDSGLSDWLPDIDKKS